MRRPPGLFATMSFSSERSGRPDAGDAYLNLWHACTYGMPVSMARLDQCPAAGAPVLFVPLWGLLRYPSMIHAHLQLRTRALLSYLFTERSRSSI